MIKKFYWVSFLSSLVARLIIAFYGGGIGIDEINFYKMGPSFWKDFESLELSKKAPLYEFILITLRFSSAHDGEVVSY